MLVSARKHPWILLLASLLVLLSVGVMRFWNSSASLPLPQAVSEPARPAVERSDPSIIGKLKERIQKNPADTDAQAQLGHALLQRVRETADPNLYTQADTALKAALQQKPEHLDALVGMGTLALARHQFSQALEWGQKVQGVSPWTAQAYGIQTDALIELGRYDEAVAMAQKMVDTRPDTSSYSRISYIRELYGDMPGAMQAMQQAIDAGDPQSEQTVWCIVQLGNLSFNQGKLDDAERLWQKALQLRPGYLPAQGAIAKGLAARGKLDEAIKLYRDLVDRMPLPEFVIALGELYEINGQQDEATREYQLVHVIQELNAGSGMNVDLELALFDADHHADAKQTLERARAAYAARPSIYGADALAWALYNAKFYTEARKLSQEALRLGTRDAALLYRAGMIAIATGEEAEGRRLLQQALDINPYFSLRHAPEVRTLLAQAQKGSP